jgi:anaerobic ribonucleoside-triphosphate reductase activating protein
MQPLEAREIVSPDEVCARVADAKSAYGIEGVTFLGGEPFLQADGLAQVAESARALGLSVMVFTGFTLNECRSLPGGERLLAVTDVLVDGPYEKDRPETHRNWVGSQNQRFHYLTARYDPSIETDGR